jgi:chromosome segregation ATPase
LRDSSDGFRARNRNTNANKRVTPASSKRPVGKRVEFRIASSYNGLNQQRLARLRPATEVTMSADNLDTKPTIETVLQRINALAEKMDAQSTDIKDIKKDIAELGTRLDEELGKVHARLDTELGKINERLDEYEERFDRLESVSFKTRSEFVDMRADFREWRKQLKDLLPPVA